MELVVVVLLGGGLIGLGLSGLVFGVWHGLAVFCGWTLPREVQFDALASILCPIIISTLFVSVAIGFYLDGSTSSGPGKPTR